MIFARGVTGVADEVLVDLTQGAKRGLVRIKQVNESTYHLIHGEDVVTVKMTSSGNVFLIAEDGAEISLGKA